MTMLEEISRFQPGCAQEATDQAVMADFLRTHPDAFSRENPVGHVTVSAWVLDRAHQRVAMAYHNIYRSWSWIGGHADGEEDLRSAILREIREEIGVKEVRLVTPEIFSLETLAVSAHVKRGEYVPSHLHFNVTFLAEAGEEALHRKPDENSAVGWFTPEEALSASTEPWMVEHVYRKLIGRAAPYMR